LKRIPPEYDDKLLLTNLLSSDVKTEKLKISESYKVKLQQRRLHKNKSSTADSVSTA